MLACGGQCSQGVVLSDGVGSNFSDRGESGIVGAPLICMTNRRFCCWAPQIGELGAPTASCRSCLLNGEFLYNCHCSVVAAESADSAAPPGTGTAEKKARVAGIDTPPFGCGISGGVILKERPLQGAVEDIASCHIESMFKVQCGLGFNAWPPHGVFEYKVLDGLSQHRVQGGKDSSLELVSAGIIVFFVNPPVRRVQTENGDCLSPGSDELRREDARVSQGVAINLAR